MMKTELLAPIIFMPLIGAAILGIWGKHWSEKLIGAIACSTVGISTVLSFYLVFAKLLVLPADGRLLTQHLFTWIKAGSFRADFAFMVDPLSAVMLLFVTFVAFWIHVFATGYMHGEDGYYRFFAYLNLFMFMMLTLILADNFLLMFVGWEGVGLCSYLLIGYYFLKDSANDAAKKAFIVNRIGDAGFVLGVMLIFLHAGTISFIDKTVDGASVDSSFARLGKLFLNADPLWVVGTMTAIALLLFVGAIGKSAQIPLFVWLPDAMAGPTPVSALIHAATMVTAGVYMVARCSPIYTKSPTAMFVVAVVGGATALLAATIAIAQWDIKKVLAYSTVSQLGYMFLACGAGGFSAGIFHVFTHSFFKALLFLGAGSIIIGMHHEQDLRFMGGLKKYMPKTFWTVAMGWLAISGVPLFSGFFSKDDILYRTFSSSSLPSPWGAVLWVAGVATAGLTAIYMTRLVVLAFFGDERYRPHHEEGAHEVKAAHGHEESEATEDRAAYAHRLIPRESPANMWIPLVVLAVLSVAGGWIGISEGLTGGRIPNAFEHFLEPAIAKPVAISGELTVSAEHAESHTLELALTGLSAIIGIGGILIGWSWFKGRPLWQPPSLLENKYWVDEVYNRLFVEPIKSISTEFFWKVFDVKIIDGAVNGAAWLVSGMGDVLRLIQVGFTRVYAALILAGALVVIGYFLIGLNR